MRTFLIFSSNWHNIFVTFSPIYDAYCANHYANDHCDYGCNNEECNWDGMDCEPDPPNKAIGTIEFTIPLDTEASFG